MNVIDISKFDLENLPENRLEFEFVEIPDADKTNSISEQETKEKVTTVEYL